jgi:pimeloyl-ACP methyl ester carboxylesterase
VAVLMSAAFASVAGAASARLERVIMKGGIEVTPEETHVRVPGVGHVNLDKVGIIKIEPKGESAKNVLVLEPGTSAAAAYFVPFAKALIEDPEMKGWQVWAVERRQNFLENQKELTKFKSGELMTAENPKSKKDETPAEQFFNYYFGYLADPDVTHHYQPVLNSTVEFAKKWGMEVAVDDLNVVITDAEKKHGKVVLGGHSLGGSVVTAYATWDFSGKPGAEGLSGLVYDDGGSSPLAISEEEAKTALAKLDETKETPWLAFGGIPAPDLGLFSATGSTLAAVEPKGPSLLETFPYLPSDLKSPTTPVTNEAGFGYSVNYLTSPVSLAAAQIHGGTGVEEEAETDGLHGWNGAGARTPVKRYAEMLSGTGVRNASGSEWYFPARLTLDTGAVGNGLENPAQAVLGVHSTMGMDLTKADLGRELHILAIDTELDKLFAAEGERGGEGETEPKQTTLTEAEALAEQNGIKSENVKLINRLNSYSHNDPAGALPEEHEGVEANIFFKELIPFLEKIAKNEEGS